MSCTYSHLKFPFQYAIRKMRRERKRERKAVHKKRKPVYSLLVLKCMVKSTYKSMKSMLFSICFFFVAFSLSFSLLVQPKLCAHTVAAHVNCRRRRCCCWCALSSGGDSNRSSSLESNSMWCFQHKNSHHLISSSNLAWYIPSLSTHGYKNTGARLHSMLHFCNDFFFLFFKSKANAFLLLMIACNICISSPGWKCWRARRVHVFRMFIWKIDREEKKIEPKTIQDDVFPISMCFHFFVFMHELCAMPVNDQPYELATLFLVNCISWIEWNRKDILCTACAVSIKEKYNTKTLCRQFEKRKKNIVFFANAK